MENAKIIPEKSEGMKFLFDMGRAHNEIHTIEINGETYTTDSLRHVERVYPARPSCFNVATLEGLVTYLQSGVDIHPSATMPFIVSVENPREVCVYSPIYGENQKRDLLARCVVEQPRLDVNHYMDPESFNVMLQTHIIQSPNRDLVLKFVGSLKDEQSNQTADDGFSQRVTIKTGVAAVGEVTVVNPVSLAPRRTFPEIEQPESNYVLRFKEGPNVALFSTDDLTWRHAAIASIGDWLRDRLGDGFIVVA